MCFVFLMWKCWKMLVSVKKEAGGCEMVRNGKGNRPPVSMKDKWK